MAYVPSNAAYDFERFEKKSAKSKPVLNVVSNPKYKKRDVMTVVRVISGVALVVTVICISLYYRARLTELAQEISVQKSLHESLMSENTRLKAEMESKVSLRGVEEGAKQLGMSKMQSYQIEYVDIKTDEEVTLSGNAADISLTEKLNLYIQTILE